MTIRQTIEIPADRRVYFDLPETARIGTATVILEFPSAPNTVKPKREDSLLALCGMFKTDGHDTDRFLARSHAERVRENWRDERQRQESLAFREGREPPSGEWVNPLLGIAKDSSLTVERFMEMQEEEIDLENEYDKRARQESGKYRRGNEA
jgi:hypothetical protein